MTSAYDAPAMSLLPTEDSILETLERDGYAIAPGALSATTGGRLARFDRMKLGDHVFDVMAQIPKTDECQFH